MQSTTGSRGVRISGSNAGYTMFRGRVKSTGYPLQSPVSPPLPLPCVTVCHNISTGLYVITFGHTTFGGTPLDEGSAPSQTPLPGKTQHTKETDVLEPGVIRTRSIRRPKS